MVSPLQERLETSFKKLKGQGKITEINISDTLKDVRRALTDADVNYNVAKEFIKTVKTKALGQNVLNAVKPQELMLKIVHEELASLMGNTREPLNIKKHPSVILMSGLQGSGKTTFSGKLANMLKTRNNRKPLLVACDVYRPAAIEQLKVVGESVGVPVYSEEGVIDPVGIAQRGVQYGRDNKFDIIIIDTAGRLAVDEKMMDEIAAIRETIKPEETLFVVDAMTGQDAVNTAKAFNDRIDFDGVVLTKLDGDTRGGAALTMRRVVDKPIKFVGTGEKMDEVQEFDPEGMASRILGMGDIGELIDRVKRIYDEKEAKDMEEKIRKNKFDYNDFLAQIANIKKMGNIKDLASMIPGMGKAIKDIDIDNSAFTGIEAIIYSMTPYERSHPDKIDQSRRRRIAAGSGRTIQEVNNLMKQFENTRKMMRTMTSGSKMKQMAKLAGMKGMLKGRR